MIVNSLKVDVPEHGKCKASIMPKIQSQKYQNVPPLMAMPNNINQSWNQSLGNPGHVKKECQATNKVHEHDPWKHGRHQRMT